MKYEFKPIKFQKMVKTTDDWFPCFPNDEVRGSVMIVPNVKNIMVRLCYWGADDFGMEKDIYYNLGEKGYMLALKKYNTLLNELMTTKVVTIMELYEKDFKNA